MIPIFIKKTDKVIKDYIIFNHFDIKFNIINFL